ncbi:unnamed protein product [Toxocara canis]|uniref:Serine/threonine-protein phosphatase n=1 Tax=Toxocara canis TaxID=6265 RepID=A0A183UYW0_TOXCA|nr:unnamed protein product [Toxocara canis]
MVKVLMEECSLIEIEPPDMQRLFDLIGRVPDIKLLFLGDYVDRGPQSLETIMYLFTLKLRYKDRIFLLRGNHEIAMVNRIYGFYAECATKYGAGIWWDFQSVFNRLPIAALISGRILCMHGGLSPNLNSLDQIRQINRPCEPAGAGTVTDLLWADPTNKGSGWFFSPRGISYAFGKEVVSAVCRQLHIDLVIRGHQVVQDGYEIMTGRMLITVFSAPNYAGQFNNAAAAVCLDEDLKISFQQIRIPPTNPNCTRTCPPIACDPGKSLDPPPILKKHRTNSPAALEQVNLPVSH